MSKNLTNELGFLTIDETAALLGYKNPRSLKNRIFKKLPAPPYIQVPGSRSMIFVQSDVIAFMMGHKRE